MDPLLDNPNQGGGQNQDRSWIPESLRSDKTFEKFTSPEGVFKSYAELEKRLGSSVSIPKEDSTEDDRKKFYERIRGVDSPDKYDLAEVSDEKERERVKKVMFDAGLRPEQVKAIIDHQKQERNLSESVKAEKARNDREEAEINLRREHGVLYDAKIAAANKALNDLFPGSMKVLVDSGLVNNAALVNELARLGEKLSPDGFTKGTTPKPKAPSIYDQYDEKYKQ